MMTDLASTTPQSLGRDPMVGLRLARVDGFEPAIALGQDELTAYLRRFTMLFADDATMRRGGIGRVTRAVNAQGEAVALKQLILPTRDEFDDDAAHEALVAKFKAAFREEYECHRALSGLSPPLWLGRGRRCARNCHGMGRGRDACPLAFATCRGRCRTPVAACGGASGSRPVRSALPYEPGGRGLCPSRYLAR